MTQQLTVKEALEQGYEYYVYNDDGYQALNHISYMEMDFKRDDISIVNKDSYHPLGLDAKSIAELLAETINYNHACDSGDDTEQVYNAIMDIDFSDVEQRISEALSKLHYYRSSNIKLIP